MTIPNNTAISSLISDAYFYDTFSYPMRYENQSALDVYMMVMKGTPNWVHKLMALRNKIVSKLGLKDLGKMSNFDLSRPNNEYRVGDSIGIFKLYSISENEVILEDRDKHLDVKVSFYLEPNGETATVHASTVVHVKNTLGKIYMFFVTPIHKIIVPSSLTVLPKA